MTAHRFTLDCFRRAGHAHLHGASRILNGQPARGTSTPALVPGSAAYLAHVALECALKARLLSRDGYASAEALAEKQPRVHAALFRSTQGHDLAALAGYLRLNAFVETQGKPWLDDDCWKRMASSQRPYSLRYGAEPVAQASTQEEINRASALVEVLLQGLKTPPLRKKRRGTR